jgi:hypothetical protein
VLRGGRERSAYSVGIEEGAKLSAATMGTFCVSVVMHGCWQCYTTIGTDYDFQGDKLFRGGGLRRSRSLRLVECCSVCYTASENCEGVKE